MIERRLIGICILLVFIVLVFLLDRKKLVYLIAAVLPMSLSTRYGDANIYMILGIAGADMLKNLGRRETYEIPFVALGLLGFILFAYFTSFATNYWELDFPKGLLQSKHTIMVLTVISCVAYFLMIVRSMETVADIRVLLAITVLAYFVSAGAAVFQLIDPTNLYFYENFTHIQSIAVQEARGGVRVYGTLGEYELFAEYSAIVIMVLIYFLLTPKQPLWKRVLTIALVLAAFYFLAMTKTRGALIALTLSLGYVLAMQAKVIGLGRTFALLMVIVCLYGSAYFFLTQSGGYNVIDHIATTENVDIKEGRFDNRTKVWTGAVKNFTEAKQQKQIWGKGPGIESGTKQLKDYPHSFYLYSLLAVGVVGLFAYMMWFVYLYFGRLPREAEARRLAIFMKALLILFLIDQLKIEALRLPAYQHIVWSLFAALYVVNKKGLIQETAQTTHVTAQKPARIRKVATIPQAHPHARALR